MPDLQAESWFTMAIEMKKADVDKAVRAAGEALIDLSDLTQTSGNTWVGMTVVNGYERFFEVKITAKKLGYSSEDVQLLLDERAEVEARKAAAKSAAAKKAEKDKARRSAKKDAE